MSKYGRSERYFAQILSYLPGIKSIVKRIYQYLNFLLNKKKYTFRSTYSIHEISSRGETFFGYYDKSPENINSNYLIYQSSTFSTKKRPNPNQPVKVVLKNTKENREIIIDDSYSYNWQQGTKLQWLTPELFIYNFFDSKNNAYRSSIYNAAENKKVSTLDYPIYDCFSDQYGLTINFNRLYNLRPDYGYRNIVEDIDFNDNSKDGIYRIDLRKNISTRLFSIEDIIGLSPLNSMKGAKHKINHIMISPNGEDFMFMHRWFIPGGKKFDRLLISDQHGKNIKILTDEGMVSHCCWLDNDHIVGYFRHHSHGDSYYKIAIKTGKIDLLSNKLVGFGDGHPTFLKSKMVFDSYPDRSRHKHLYIYDIEKNEVTEIGQFYEPLKYFGETRCDLHPKWNFKGDRIYVDSVHEGVRKLYEIRIE